MREKHNGHTDTGRGKREGRVTLLSRSAKRPDTMSQSGFRLPQSRSNVSVAPSSAALLARSRMSKYLPEMYIPPRWSFSAFVPSRSRRKKKRERERGSAYYPGIIVARFIGRIGSEIGKPQICFGHCCTTMLDLERFSTSSAFGPLLLKRGRAPVKLTKRSIGMS